MRKEVEQLALMGAMPDETDEPTDVLIDKAHILIKLFPPTALYGIEWTLLHLIESVYPETEFIKYKELINECNSVEFREMLVQRLNNSQQNKVTNK